MLAVLQSQGEVAVPACFLLFTSPSRVWDPLSCPPRNPCLQFWRRKFLLSLVFSVNGRGGSGVAKGHAAVPGKLFHRTFCVPRVPRAASGLREPAACTTTCAFTCRQHGTAGHAAPPASLLQVPLFLLSMVLMYIPGPKNLIELKVGGFMLGELVAFVLATPVQVGGWLHLFPASSQTEGAWQHDKHCACCAVPSAPSTPASLYSRQPHAYAIPPAPPLQFVVGWTFHRGAWRALRRGRANMDVLVSVGTNAGKEGGSACGKEAGSWQEKCSAAAAQTWTDRPPSAGQQRPLLPPCLCFHTHHSVPPPPSQHTSTQSFRSCTAECKWSTSRMVSAC